MYTKFTTSTITLLTFLLCLFSPLTIQPVFAAGPISAPGSTYLIHDIGVKTDATSVSMTIKGDSLPAFTKYETHGPFRLVLDIAGATLAQSLDKDKLLPVNTITSLTTTLLSEQTPPLLRFEFTLQKDAPYSVDTQGNSIVVVIRKGAGQTAKPKTPPQATGLVLQAIDVTTGASETQVLLKANRSITNYKSNTVKGNKNLPDRMFIDIDHINGSALAKEKVVENGVLKKIRVAKRGTGIRVVFDSGLPDLFQFDIAPDPEGLLIHVNQTTPAQKKSPLKVTHTAKKSSPDSTLEALLGSSIKKSAPGQPDPLASSPQMKEALDKFDFSGYKKKKISIDFFKIDIHNVFRLLREITDLNIVVDEDVTGTLTLALDDVPWDFALDIILNLTDLEKKERFNTIVIYPKKKHFDWPEKVSDSLDVSVDLEIIEEESLIVQKAASQPKEILHAKSIMRKAQNEEKQKNYESAVNLYEQAFKLWPANHKLANKLATLYLVGLRINAKAVNYAKKSLELNPQNTKAALYAAIGSANMNRLPEAMEYFNQAVSSNPPMQEALVSYAAFSERNDQPEAALKLLDKYYTHYGDTVNTMVARARIYDKLGQTDKAAAQYKAVLNSGFQLRPDLKKFIRGRIAAKGLKTGSK